MSNPFAWRPLFLCMPDTQALELHGHAIARVDNARQGTGHVVTINLHLEYARRTTAALATRTLALKLTERWARANQLRLQRELADKFAEPRQKTSYRRHAK